MTLTDAAGEPNADPRGDSITIIVPTVASREAWLEECLSSIRAADQGQEVYIYVSGNGTRPASAEIARRYKATYVHRPGRLTASEHHMLLVEETRSMSGYVWMLGDDDVVAPNGISVVLAALAEGEAFGAQPTGIVGRARHFSDSTTHLSPPDPEIWNPGYYRSIETLADATEVVVHLGAFVIQTGVLTPLAYQRYTGTSHEIFGALWDGMCEQQDLIVSVVEEPLVYLRQAQKEWDYSELRTSAGRIEYHRRLPPTIAVRARGPEPLGVLTRRKAVDLARSRAEGERKYLLQHARNRFVGHEPLAPLLLLLPPIVAKGLLALNVVRKRLL
ncbi:MAG: glycosyltransferase [Actinomycetes bacterium]